MLTDTNRERPPRQTLVACPAGDTLGGSAHVRTDPVGRLLFTVLVRIADFSLTQQDRSGRAKLAALPPISDCPAERPTHLGCQERGQ
jgi:hypothetical protein